MAVEYAPEGLLGTLTPQANTTVEPEFAVLMPAGTAWINARLTSPKPTIEERLVDYFATMESALDQFANAPIGAVAVACTGASYLAGPEAEDAMIARATAKAGVPVVTSGIAVVAALNALGARKIGLVSPYTPGLNAASGAYWRARGFAVTAQSDAYRDSPDFHPIYSLTAAAAAAALEAMEGQDVDAIVMLGTGMPTLAPILARPFIGRAPVLSCMLATAWRGVAAMQGRKPDRNDL
ncbi:MAG: aspartate/glutamate racemase family protein, partial [Azospirillum sp.]|nr:aspartate/glutamate racemase family protein [Azospirillum sp.]